MNDVVFSGIYRNLKPDSERGSTPWFVVTSNDHRKSFVHWCQQRSIGGSNPAFFVTRLLTMSVFAMFYLWMLVRTLRSPHEFEIERFAWVMAVFLFLQPTVNPWYWVWVAPLACFTNSKGWLLVSGILSVYYLRFWFQDSSSEDSFGRAARLFDHGVAWLEFAAILAVAIFCVVHSRKAKLAEPT